MSAADNKYRAKVYRERDRKGQCVKCGGKRTGTGKACERCLSDRREALNALRAQRVADGFCSDCGRFKIYRAKRCAVHWLQQQEWRQKQAPKKAEAKAARKAARLAAKLERQRGIVERKAKPAPQQIPLPIGIVKRREIPEIHSWDFGSPQHLRKLKAMEAEKRTKPFTEAEREADRIEEMIALSEIALSFRGRPCE